MTFIENFLEKYDHNTNIKIIKNFKHRNSLRKGGTPPPLNILNTIHAHTILVMSPNFATEEACKCFDSYTFKKFFLLCFSIYNLIGSAGRQEQKITLLSTLKAVQLNRTMASIYYFC